MRKPSTECPWAEANKDSQWADKFESYLGETCETYPVFTQINLDSIWHGYRYKLSVARLIGIRPTSDIEWVLKPAPAMPAGTLWTLTHDSEGVVTVFLGPHPHGFELRLVLNNRFLRSRVHRELAGVLADAADTRQRFSDLGFEELPPRFVH